MKVDKPSRIFLQKLEERHIKKYGRSKSWFYYISLLYLHCVLVFQQTLLVSTHHSTQKRCRQLQMDLLLIYFSSALQVLLPVHLELHHWTCLLWYLDLFTLAELRTTYYLAIESLIGKDFCHLFVQNIIFQLLEKIHLLIIIIKLIT